MKRAILTALAAAAIATPATAAATPALLQQRATGVQAWECDVTMARLHPGDLCTYELAPGPTCTGPWASINPNPATYVCSGGFYTVKETGVGSFTDRWWTFATWWNAQYNCIEYGAPQLKWQGQLGT